jgi:signal transduction histidine kinase
MSRFKNSSVRIVVFITLFPLVSLSLYGVLSHLFFINTQQKVIQQDLQKTASTLMEMEQNNLREKVENLTLFIQYHHSKNIEKSKNKLREVVYFAADIANNLYQKNRHVFDEKSLKALIISALKAINFGKSIDYLFLQDLDGNALIHRDEALINTNTLNLRDINGKYIIKEFNKIISEKGEGFASYYWYKTPENKNSVYSKQSFVKRLDAYNWYVGAGEKTEATTMATREEILDYIHEHPSFNDGYFFISDSNNQTIFDPKLHHHDDLQQFRVEGLFKDQSHLAYTLYVAQFDWYITAVKELSAIRKNIALKKNESTQAIKDKVTTQLYLIMLSWFISLALSLYLSLLMYRMLKRYKTELSNTNQKLIFQSRQATIGELLPMIAHQWRQPINKIASTLALMRFNLLAKSPDHKEIDNQCYSIEKNIEFMSETIDDFRTFYQPKKTQTEENLKELIARSLAFLEPSIRSKGIETACSLDAIVTRVYGNEFMQVIINLLENAVEAVPEAGGRIKISLASKMADEIIVSIEDNGRGIDDDAMHKIFEPYFSTRKGSMGLGLYMCKMIVEQHLKGQITVEKLVVGTRFVITL